MGWKTQLQNTSREFGTNKRPQPLVLIWNLPQPEVLKIEFKAEVKRKDQLVAVVDRAKGWKFPRKDGSHLPS